MTFYSLHIVSRGVDIAKILALLFNITRFIFIFFFWIYCLKGAFNNVTKRREFSTRQNHLGIAPNLAWLAFIINMSPGMES